MAEGLRIKARVPAELWGDVKAAAAWAGCSVEDWTFAVCRDFDKGKFGVPSGFNVELGTRAGSVTPWVRVQEISEEDARAKGVEATCRKFGGCQNPTNAKPGKCPSGCNCFNARENFAGLWDGLHGEGAWKENT